MKTQLLHALRGRSRFSGARQSAGLLETVSYEGSPHVLIPHRCNWREEPDWQREWENEVADGVIGNQRRRGMRVQPRVRLAWTISPRDLQEHSLLNERIRAARKSGLACAPFWGRASVLSANLTGQTLLMEATTWGWAVNDFVFLMDADGNFEVRQIEQVISTQELRLLKAVGRTYAAGLQVWPLVFGKLIAEDMPAETSHRGNIRCAIQELVSPATSGVGAFNITGRGIGVMRIGSTFIVGADRVLWRLVRSGVPRGTIHPVVRQWRKVSFFRPK
jgi:hypothetical protein